MQQSRHRRPPRHLPQTLLYRTLRQALAGPRSSPKGMSEPAQPLQPCQTLQPCRKRRLRHTMSLSAREAAQLLQCQTQPQRRERPASLAVQLLDSPLT